MLGAACWEHNGCSVPEAAKALALLAERVLSSLAATALVCTALVCTSLAATALAIGVSGKQACRSKVVQLPGWRCCAK